MLLTAVFAFLHLTARTPEVSGEIIINGQSVHIGDLPLEPVTGTVVNGKGQKTQIDAPGIALSELFGSDVTVTAADSYRAEVKKGELADAFLILDGDSLRLVVFGDADAKRNVKNVAEVDRA